MKCHPLRKLVRKVECLVNRIREEFKNGSVAPPKPVNIICPVNKQATPDHNEQDRKVKPVKPSNCKRMFFDDLLHGRILGEVNVKTKLKVGIVIIKKENAMKKITAFGS